MKDDSRLEAPLASFSEALERSVSAFPLADKMSMSIQYSLVSLSLEVSEWYVMLRGGRVLKASTGTLDDPDVALYLREHLADDGTGVVVDADKISGTVDAFFYYWLLTLSNGYRSEVRKGNL